MKSSKVTSTPKELDADDKDDLDKKIKELKEKREELIASLQADERERQWHYTQLELISQKTRSIHLTSSQSYSLDNELQRQQLEERARQRVARIIADQTRYLTYELTVSDLYYFRCLSLLAAARENVSTTSTVGAAQTDNKQSGALEKTEDGVELITCEPDVDIVWAGQEISHLQEKLDLQAVEQSVLVAEIHKLKLNAESQRVQLAAAESDLDHKQKDVDVLKVFNAFNFQS